MRNLVKTFLKMSLVFYLPLSSFAQLFIHDSNYEKGYRQELSLQGEWKFIIGDNLDYAKVTCDDSDWNIISVPAYWENEGYPGYDGYAWYRLNPLIPKKLKDNNLYLRLGRIDDVDEVYINGHKLNQWGFHGQFYRSSLAMDREYEIPPDLLHFGKKNLIAVRVYDQQGSGGIYQGPIGLFSRPEIDKLILIHISGFWKFNSGDNLLWATPDFNDSEWDSLIVPCFWEHQGYSDLDGFAWYRKEIHIPGKYTSSELILAAGKINDVDEVYFNGILIGRTGSIEPLKDTIDGISTWRIERFYRIPHDLIRYDQPNTIAVRIFDAMRTGGIWYGPLGLTTLSAYEKYKKGVKK